MPQKEIVETFEHQGFEYHVMGRDGRYYIRVVDEEGDDTGPFASVELAKASILEPGADGGAPVEEPQEPDEPEDDPAAA